MRPLSTATPRTAAIYRALARGKADVLRARSEIRDASKRVDDVLFLQQQLDLAQQVRQFADRMSPAVTEKEAIAVQLLERARTQATRDRGSFSR